MDSGCRRFTSEDEEAQHWLAWLRDGTEDQKVEARDSLSRIFQRRGMLTEAIQLLEGNGRAGVRDSRLFTRLADLYRRVGREDDAEAAEYEAALLTSASHSHPSSAPEPPPTARSTGANREDDPLGFRPGAPRPWFLRMPGLILLSGLCLPPMAIALVWVRPWRQSLKIALTVPLALWMLMYFAIAFGSGQPRQTATSSPQPTSQAAVQRITPTPQTQQASRPAPSSQVAPTPRSTATPIPATPTPPPPKVIVVNAGPEGVAFRDAPATGERLRLLKDGESLERIGDEETLAAEKRWWKIRDGEGKEGWASREFLLKDTDVEERARFMEYGRAMWRLAALSDKSNAEVFDAMRGVSSPAQIVVAYAVAQRNVNTHADLLTTARGISTTDRGNQARQSLVDVLTTRKQTAEKIAKALATRTDRDLETAKQAIESSQTAMIPFAANFVGLALDLRVDYQTEFKD